MAHKHVDLGAVAAARVGERLRSPGRDVRRQFESRHHGLERGVGSLVAPSPAGTGTSSQAAPRRGIAARLLLSIATRTDAD